MIKSIIFDWKRTLYDPDNKRLLEGTKELLLYLKKKNIPLFLIGKGDDKMRQEVKRLGADKFFTKIIFSDKKDINQFSQFISKDQPQNSYVIGDRVRSEIEIGNKLKAMTIWIKQGKFSEELPLNSQQKPKIIVSSLLELLNLFKKIKRLEKPKDY